MRINNNNYKEVLKGISVIEVSGESCANCISLMPILHSIVSSRNDCVLHHIEVEEDTLELIDMFGVVAVPSILIMNDDKVFAKCKGYQPEEILELWIDAKIEELKQNK